MLYVPKFIWITHYIYYSHYNYSSSTSCDIHYWGHDILIVKKFI
jgi:hypothetical protein